MHDYGLTPGVLDAAAEGAFTTGACAALAIALHDRTGWPLAMITDRWNVHYGIPTSDVGRVYAKHGVGRPGDGSALHWGVFVEHPQGTLLFVDVDGARPITEVVEEYHDEADDGEAAAGLAVRADAVEQYVDNQGEPVPIEVARTFVHAVLHRAFPTRFNPPLSKTDG